MAYSRKHMQSSWLLTPVPPGATLLYAMAQCAQCTIEETNTYLNGSPICLRCAGRLQSKADRASIEGTLIQVLADASSRAAAAHAEFIAAVDNIPSGLPHPDGTQRIQNASRKLRAARDDMKSAHSRLDSFMITGIVPED